MQKLLMTSILTIGCTITLGLSACKNQDQEGAKAQAVSATKLPAGFSEFYQQFHADSIFQIEHISWPLGGNMVKDSVSGVHIDQHYDRASWQLHRPISGNSEFDQRFRVLTDGLVEELISSSVGNYNILRRFALLDEEWHLIYYRTTSL